MSKNLEKKLLAEALDALVNDNDVAKAYPQIYRSRYSGFNTSFDLPTASTNGLQLVLRFTDDPAGNGNSSDQWIKLNKFSLAD